MDEFRIEKESPLVDLRAGQSFYERSEAWLSAAHKLVSDAIAQDRNDNGHGEEVNLYMTNRQADHLAMGLTILSSHFRRAAARAA